MLTYNNLHLKFTATEKWHYEAILKPQIEIEADDETGELFAYKKWTRLPRKKDYELIRNRIVEIDATFLGVEISSLIMMTFVYGHIESWLYRKLGEYQEELNGLGGPNLGGYLFFKKTQKKGREYLYVTVQENNEIVREQYFNYPDVAQLKQAMQKLMTCMRI